MYSLIEAAAFRTLERLVVSAFNRSKASDNLSEALINRLEPIAFSISVAAAS